MISTQRGRFLIELPVWAYVSQKAAVAGAGSTTQTYAAFPSFPSILNTHQSETGLDRLPRTSRCLSSVFSCRRLLFSFILVAATSLVDSNSTHRCVSCPTKCFVNRQLDHNWITNICSQAIIVLGKSNMMLVPHSCPETTTVDSAPPLPAGQYGFLGEPDGADCKNWLTPSNRKPVRSR